MRTALTVLLLAPLATGCVAVAAGAAAGYVISREVLPNDVHTATVADDVEVVWEATQEAMRARSTEPVQITAMPRTVVGEVDGATVTVEVQAYDLDVTIVRVRAKRFIGSGEETATRVLEAILDRLPGT